MLPPRYNCLRSAECWCPAGSLERVSLIWVFLPPRPVGSAMGPPPNAWQRSLPLKRRCRGLVGLRPSPERTSHTNTTFEVRCKWQEGGLYLLMLIRPGLPATFVSRSISQVQQSCAAVFE